MTQQPLALSRADSEALDQDLISALADCIRVGALTLADINDLTTGEIRDLLGVRAAG
jgi:hypothetical protein